MMNDFSTFTLEKNTQNQFNKYTMLKKIFPLALLFTSSMFGQVAKDTLWVDSFDYKVSKKEATAFKLVKPIKGQELNIIETFDAKTKKLQAKGKGLVQEDLSILYSGNVENFTSEGKLISTYIYNDKGEVTKITSVNQFTGEKYEGIFREGQLFSGELFQNWSNVYIKMSTVDGVFREYEILNPANAKNRQTFIFDEENVIVEEQYYGVNGELVNQAEYLNGSPFNGTITSINYEKFGVKELNTYTDGNLVAYKSLYTTGQTKSTAVINEERRVEDFFHINGQKLGQYILDYDEDEYVGKQEGTAYYFNYSGNEDDISSAYHFVDNSIQKVEEYYVNTKNNSLKSATNYNEDGSLEKTVYYNENGTVKGQLTYDENGYSPYNGLYLESNSSTTYKDGKIVEKTAFYDNGKVFEQRKENLSIFLDKKGKELGRVTQGINPDYGLESFIDGTVYSLTNDEISQITKYKNGEMTYDSSFDVVNGKAILQLETFYAFGNISKVISYYPNGVKSKIANYSTQSYSYEPSTATYFDQKGKELGTYNYDTKTGTYYEFNANGQVIQMAKYNAGIPVYSKQYAPVTRDMFATNPKYYLQNEVDYNKQGKFYDVTGKLISTVTYKDGVPYNGTTYVMDEYTMTETSYKDGKKIGVETVSFFSYEYTEQGYNISSKTYYENGEKVKVEDFIQGNLQTSTEYKGEFLHGMYFTYDEEGTEISRLQYNEGIPYQGILVEESYDYNYKKTFAEGELVEVVFSDKSSGIVIAKDTYTDENSLSRIVFDEEGNTVYKYSLVEDNLEGLYQYFEKGKVKYQATFTEGILQEGTVAVEDVNFMADNYSYAVEEQENFTVLDLKKNKLKVAIYKQESKEEIYNMEAKIKKADNTVDPILSKKIVPANLYPVYKLDANSNYWY